MVGQLFFFSILLKKNELNKDSPVKTSLYMAFSHSFSFSTVLAANFGCNWFRITPEIVSKLLRTGCALQFESEQMPFFWQVVEYVDSFLCLLLIQRTINDKKFSEAISTDLVCNRFLQNPSKFQFWWKNRSDIKKQQALLVSCLKALVFWNSLWECLPELAVLEHGHKFELCSLELCSVAKFYVV